MEPMVLWPWVALAALGAAHGINPGMGWLFAVAVGVVIPGSLLQWGVAILLFALGIRQLIRHAHPRYGGMRMGPRQLTIWSFLMASAHGAGLMALPVVLGASSEAPQHGAHAAHHGSAAADPLLALTGSAVHAVGYLAVTGVVALVVYHRVGLQRIRSLWVNINLIWAAALLITAVLTPLG